MGNDEPLETEQASEAPRPSKASRAEKRAAGNKGEKGKRGKGRKASDDDAAEARQRASDDADDNADDNASDDADEGSAPGEASDAAEGDGAGDLYRPPFARRYPRDPELDRLLRAFVEGNNALVFREAPELAKKTDDKAVARAALDLHQRLKPDPLAAAMLAGAGLLLLFLVLWFYTHRHGH